MSCLRRNVYDIAGTKPLALAVFDRGPAHFVGRGGFRIDYRSSNHEGRLAALDHEKIGLRLMQFGFAAAFAMDDAESVIAVACQRLRRNLVLVDFRRKVLLETFQLGAFPLTESCRICRAENGCRGNGYKEQFH